MPRQLWKIGGVESLHEDNMNQSCLPNSFGRW